MNRCILLIVVLICFLGSCKPSDETPAPTGAGKGGVAVLRVIPRHHSNEIDSCTIYVKYNATSKPTDNRYDDSAKCVQVGGMPVATFPGLKKGQYFVHGFGFDPAWAPPTTVKGSFAYNLSNETTQTLDLAVSE